MLLTRSAHRSRVRIREACSLEHHCIILARLWRVTTVLCVHQQVVLHSVKYDTLVLGTSPINDPVPSDHPSYNLRMPSVLRGKLRGEVSNDLSFLSVRRILQKLNCHTRFAHQVNGSIELRFFTINLFLSASVLNSGRAESGTKLLTGVHMFTLFHPEANSVLQVKLALLLLLFVLVIRPWQHSSPRFQYLCFRWSKAQNMILEFLQNSSVFVRHHRTATKARCSMHSEVTMIQFSLRG